jgi:hypothetical protein
MPKGMQAIYTQTASGSAATITFNNIPQTYTDLKIVVSGRGGQAAVYQQTYWRINGDTGSNYSATSIQGTGSGSGASYRESSQTRGSFGLLNGSTATASSFGSLEFCIYSYANSMYKQVIAEYITETNGAVAYQGIESGLWRVNAPVTSFQINTFGAAIAANTTVTLYGISR